MKTKMEVFFINSECINTPQTPRAKLPLSRTKKHDFQVPIIIPSHLIQKNKKRFYVTGQALAENQDYWTINQPHALPKMIANGEILPGALIYNEMPEHHHQGEQFTPGYIPIGSACICCSGLVYIKNS